MKSAVREALVAAGVSDAQLAALEAKYPSRRISINVETCPACGVKPARFDYACLACSEVKAGSERRFWQYAADKSIGHQGRPKQSKPKKQSLPPQFTSEITSILPALPVEPLPDRKPELHEYLVTIGRVGLVVVARWSFDAIRTARAALKLGENAGHSGALDLGRTELEASDYRDFWTDEENRAAEEADAKKD